MSLPHVNISLANGALGGLIATADGIMGIVVTGATEGALTVGSPFSVNSLSDLEALGVASTTTLNAQLYRQVQEFYAELGGKGIFYVHPVASTMTIAQAADGSNANGVSKLLDFAKGDIKVVGLCIEPQASPTVTNGLNALVYTAATNLQTTLSAYSTAQKPLRGLISGDSFSGTATALTNMRTSTLNRVGILIGDTVNANAGAAIGLVLGRLAKIPVQRKISRVKDGALSITTAFIGTVAADRFSATETIHDKGFITIRTLTGRNGFFFSSDPTCSPETDDYSMVARGRVIDKAHRIAYATYINEVDDEVPVEKDGTIDAGYAKYLEQLITNQVNLGMTASREISAFEATVPLDQNVTATNKVSVVAKLLPVGYASVIEVTLGFASSLA